MKKGQKTDHDRETALDPCVVGARIRDLRRRAHLSQGELARRLGMRQGPVCNIELGKNLPSTPVLLRLAEVLGVTADAILRPDAEAPLQVKEALAEYAPYEVPPIRDGVSLPDAGIAAINAIARDYLALEDICCVPRQARVPLQVPFEISFAGLSRLAVQFRALFGVNDAVVFDPLELFENHGLRVVFMPLDTVQRFSFYDAANANVFIFICADINPERQIFGLAYELGRTLLYTRSAFPGTEPQLDEAESDKAARHFAACFLMPEQAVRVSVAQTGVLPNEWDMEMLLRLKHRFGVSAEAFNYRLLELGLITATRQDKLRAAIKRHYKLHDFAEPGDSRRILSPNGRLGDLLYIALRRDDVEARAIANRLKRLKVNCKR